MRLVRGQRYELVRCFTVQSRGKNYQMPIGSGCTYYRTDQTACLVRFEADPDGGKLRRVNRNRLVLHLTTPKPRAERETRTCKGENCAEQFEVGVRQNKRFCSERCYNKHWNRIYRHKPAESDEDENIIAARWALLTRRW